MTRRSALSALCGSAALPSTAADRRPNVLLVLSDQLHHRAIGVAGNQAIHTPNLDRLALGGARFESALCPTPFCSPTRASLMTGLYPHQHGVVRNVRRGNPGLSPELPTTERALLNAGYAIKQFGKWHVGENTGAQGYAREPEASYRDYFRTVAKRMPPPARGPRNRAGRPIESVEAVRAAIAQYGHPPAANGWIGRTDVPVGHTEEAWIAGRAIRALADLAGQPFLLTVSFPAPHGPWAINEPYYGMYPRRDLPLPANRGAVEEVDRASVAWRFGRLLGEEGMREYLAVYYGMVSMMDANLGRILDELDRLGEAENTLVVFTSDHGDMQGGHGMYGKTLLSMYEETTRVPLVMRLPGRIPAGTTVRTQAGTCDISATVLDYLGVPPAGRLASRSLRPYIEGNEDLGRPIFAERDRSHWTAPGPPNFQRMIRTHEWKYCFHSLGHSQLYDLANDPGETRNLVSERAARSAKLNLHSRLTGWMAETGDPRSQHMGPA